MAKNSAAPLLIAGGAALLLMSGSKKKKSSGAKPPAGPSYGPTEGSDPMAPAYPGAGSAPTPAPKPKPSVGEDPWLERQEELVTLGYDEVGDTDGIPGPNTVKAIKAFQGDWNWFVDYLEQISPEIDYEDPYTKISVDGKWGPATESRVDKAIGKFDGHNPVHVDKLGIKVLTFRDMINGLKEL